MRWKALPVRCDRCGKLFPVSGIIGGNAFVTMQNVSVSAPCPWCGSPDGGHVPDGTYEVGESVERDLSTLDSAEVATLRSLLTEARTTQADDVVREISKIAPAIAEAIRSRPKSSWPGIIAVIVAFVALWQPADEPAPVVVDVNVNVEGDVDEPDLPPDETSGGRRDR